MISLLAGTIATTALSPGQPLWTTLLLIPWASIGQGLFFPTCTIGTLAINKQDEQAVVVTTLGLLRSLGAIHGVAVSSWIFQNFLPYYLEKDVTVPSKEEKERLISLVRKSVHAIKDLKPGLKSEVIHAYSQALRVTFASGIFWAVIVIVLTVTVKLPRLQGQSEKDEADEGTETEEGQERQRRGFGRSTSHRSRVSIDGATDEEGALMGGDAVDDTEDDEDYESYDGDVDRGESGKIESGEQSYGSTAIGKEG